MSAVAPPPVDLTMSSLSVLAEREHIGERLAHAPTVTPERRALLRPLLGVGVVGALVVVAAGIAQVWRASTKKRGLLRRLLAAG